MMKKAIIAAAVLMGTSSAAMANSAGCGLGSMIFEGQSGMVPNVLAVTTNGTSGNQTFGITFGTLGCNPNDTVTLAAADLYLDGNMERVAQDMATGQGESLETLANLLKIEEADKAAFYSMTKQNFAAIYSSDTITSREVLTSLNGLMAQDKTLSKYAS